MEGGSAATQQERTSSVDWRNQQQNKCFPIECLPEDGAFNAPLTGLPPVPSLIKKLLSEFLGTFILIFAAAGTAIMNEKSHGALGVHGLAGGAGITVMVVIFATGHISGAHINPAVTVAFATYRHFPWFQVPLYIITQVVATICAAFVLKGVYHPDLSGGCTVPVGPIWQNFLFETILTAMMMFVVTAVATDSRAVGELAGIAVGATVYLNNLIAALISGASMNPVRSLGPAIAANNFHGFWIYIVGPFLGAQIGAAAYTLIRFKDLEPQQLQQRRSFKK
ncbi:aquaporin NIP6-1-like [Selaginella moellendorffii]|uniref:aquaporin NIP6-1-like n=1 Tax=Selaginella moellendorffii TaxID=88036 RepID=UPI000D1CD628|nr:aquaporin NIP6-1-like [Selaginella moellendorffii]XP_024540526.1 aquaporin NIP6-1-like [Selaginella moellendorffii]|eukprot:XP_024537097.1 aquaporin NIP6-1-like [Selaginella moellendorffii]